MFIITYLYKNYHKTCHITSKKLTNKKRAQYPSFELQTSPKIDMARYESLTELWQSDQRKGLKKYCGNRTARYQPL